MTAVTLVISNQMAPNAGMKELFFQTDANAATGYTLTLTNAQMATIMGVYICDSTGVVKTATWSGQVLTLGTITTGIHNIRVWGI